MAKYSNPIFDFAARHPVLFVVFGTALAFDLPAQLMGRMVRQVRHGDYTLGSPAAVMSDAEKREFTGAGTTNNVSLFGQITGQEENRIAIAPPQDTGIYKGDLYRDTAFINKDHASAPGGRGSYHGDPMYTDTRHLTPVNPTDRAFEEGWLAKPGTKLRYDKSQGPQAFPADPSVVNLIHKNSVFAGLSGLGRF